MKTITTKDLTECLILLAPERQGDGEGGWVENWRRGPRVWACLWPLIDKQERSLYRVVVRTGIILPPKVGFLWPLRYALKRLSVISTPAPIQSHQFLCMTAVEEKNA